MRKSSLRLRTPRIGGLALALSSVAAGLGIRNASRMTWPTTANAAVVCINLGAVAGCRSREQHDISEAHALIWFNDDCFFARGQHSCSEATCLDSRLVDPSCDAHCFAAAGISIMGQIADVHRTVESISRSPNARFPKPVMLLLFSSSQVSFSCDSRHNSSAFVKKGAPEDAPLICYGYGLVTHLPNRLRDHLCHYGAMVVRMPSYQA